MTEKHTILGGKVHVYKRPESHIWQCSAYLDGRSRRPSTKESSLPRAKEVAEDWYLELRAKKARGELLSEKTFAQAAERFVKEYEIMTEGERNEVYLRGHKARLKNHLVPYFGKMGLSQVTAGALQDYRIFRRNDDPNFKPPAKSTMHQEIVTLRQVLKTAVRHGWLAGLPDLSEPFRKVAKVTHRAWSSPDEYRTLYRATRENIKRAGNSYHRGLAEQLHDKILFMANTGIRPDEANWLEYWDVEIVEDDATGETILEIEVHGKRGLGYCKSTNGAVTMRCHPLVQCRKANTQIRCHLLACQPAGQRNTHRVSPQSVRFNPIVCLLCCNKCYQRSGIKPRHVHLRVSLLKRVGRFLGDVARNCDHHLTVSEAIIYFSTLLPHECHEFFEVNHFAGDSLSECAYFDLLRFLVFLNLSWACRIAPNGVFIYRNDPTWLPGCVFNDCQ